MNQCLLHEIFIEGRIRSDLADDLSQLIQGLPILNPHEFRYFEIDDNLSHRGVAQKNVKPLSTSCPCLPVPSVGSGWFFVWFHVVRRAPSRRVYGSRAH